MSGFICKICQIEITEEEFQKEDCVFDCQYIDDNLHHIPCYYYACCFQCQSKKKMYYSKDSRFYCEDCFKKSGIDLHPLPPGYINSLYENIECDEENLKSMWGNYEEE